MTTQMYRITLLLSAALLTTAAPKANADIIERVVAVVNEEAIFLSELRQRVAPYLNRVMAETSEQAREAAWESLYEEGLQSLIDERLVEQVGQEMGITVTGADVERALQSVIRENQMTEPDFWRAVAAQGMTEQEYRDSIRKQLLFMRVTNQRVRSRVNITEAEVRAHYDERVGRANRRVRVHAYHAFLPLAPGASGEEVEAAMAAANELRAQMTSENFEDLAIENGGGELGWLSEGDLPGELNGPLFALTEGGISAPVRGANGVHIFYAQARERGGDALPEYDDVREQIEQQLLAAEMQRLQAAFMTELREEALIELH